MKKLDFKSMTPDYEIRSEQRGEMYEPSLGCNKVIFQGSVNVGMISLDNAQDIFDKWYAENIEKAPIAYFCNGQWIEDENGSINTETLKPDKKRAKLVCIEEL